MKTIHIAIVLSLVSLANGVQTPETEVAHAKPKTLLVTLQLVAASTNKPYKKASTYVTELGDKSCSGTTFIDLGSGTTPHLWIVEFDLDEASAKFTVSDGSYIRQGSTNGNSYSYPLELVEANMPRKDGSTYTLYGTNTEKLTICFQEKQAEAQSEESPATR